MSNHETETSPLIGQSRSNAELEQRCYQCAATVRHSFFVPRRYSGKVSAITSIDAAIAFQDQLLRDGKITADEKLNTYIACEPDWRDARLLALDKKLKLSDDRDNRLDSAFAASPAE